MTACRWIVCAGLVLLLLGCSDSGTGNGNPVTGNGKPARGNEESMALSGFTMGTRYHIKIPRLPEGYTREQIHARVEEVLERLNDLMSTYRETSEISRFNRSQEREWFPVSPELAMVVEAALQVSRDTAGAFDVTVGPLVGLWGFGPEGREQRVPGEEEIARVRAATGYRHLEARLSPSALRKLRSEIRLDLSAIAKGYGVDSVANELDSFHIKSYLVEIGGEVRTRGAKKNGEAWKVGVEAPTEMDQSAQSGHGDGNQGGNHHGVREGSPQGIQRGIQKVLALEDRALATSGDYRNFFTEAGRRYSHTIDPRTGRPVEHNLASVTVVGESCMIADALATALLVLGPDRGYAFARERNLTALFILREEAGYGELSTPAFEKLVVN